MKNAFRKFAAVIALARRSGTLAGNAHSESFSRLCAASARSISAAINRQFLRPALEEAYPHAPILVRFELAPEPVDDRLQLAQLLGAVNSAGFRPSAETVSELMNFEVQPIQQPPAGANSAPVANTCNQFAHDPGCPDAEGGRAGTQAADLDDTPDEMPEDADEELQERYMDASSMASAGVDREEIFAVTGVDVGKTDIDREYEAMVAAGADDDAIYKQTGINRHAYEARRQKRRMNKHPRRVDQGANAAFERRKVQRAREEEIENRTATITATGEAPLNEGELAALRALGGELNPAQIAADADYMTREMLAGLREPVSNTRSLLDALLVTNAAPERCGADNPAECRVHGVPPHEWTPHIMPDKMAPDKARAELLEGAQVKNPLGEDVTLDRRILRHWEKENKKADDIEKRLAALPLIKQVVAKPAEIWEAPDGSRTYLASVYNPYENAKMKDGKKTGGKKYTIVFTQAKDNTTIETYWPEAETVNKKRAGKLLFSEKRPVASDT